MTRHATTILAALLAFAGWGAALEAQEAEAPCAAAEHRQFDFWVGKWEVRDAQGEPAGTNTIEPILDGCVLSESWEGAEGSRGRSFNLYWSRDERWHQTWVDAQGGLLELAGGLDGSAMVMRGDGIARDGATVLHEIRWDPLQDGRVRQHWRVSRDGGESWNEVFLGFYSRQE